MSAARQRHRCCVGRWSSLRRRSRRSCSATSRVSLLNDIGIGALVALGLVLLTGVGGATSFGQAAFVGIAAYATRLADDRARRYRPGSACSFALVAHRRRGARDRPADAAPRRPLPAAQHHRLGARRSRSCSATSMRSAATPASPTSRRCSIGALVAASTRARSTT